MAKSCGIHIGERRYAVVLLDGSAKKHKLVFHQAGEIPSGDDPILAAASVLREIAKQVKVPSENIGLAVDSGLGAYRTLSLPFDDESKIEDVIKFEVEGDLPQWDIEDVIVDFLRLASTPGVESKLLVTAVPKELLEAKIRACERAGLEPYEAELDATAVFNAANACEMLHEDGAQVLVQIGETSTAVVVVDGGQLYAMRSIHSGASVLPSSPPEAAEDEEQSEEAAPVGPEDEQRLRDAAAERIRRELARTISGLNTENPLEGVYITGLDLPGLEGTSILDVPVARFSGLPEEPDGAGECAVAYGVALRRLGGGVLKGTLRREELRYTGKFERLELPLAVFSLLLLTALSVQLIVMNKQIHWRGEGKLEAAAPWWAFWDSGPRTAEPGDMQIWLQASNNYMLDDRNGRLPAPPADIAAYCAKAESGEDLDRTKMQELKQIERLLIIEIDKIKKQLGHISDVTHPQSSFEAMTSVLDVINSMGEGVGRIGFRSLSADTAQTRAGTDPYVTVKMNLDFFAPNTLDATRHYNDLANALEDAPWCMELDRKQNSVLDGNQGIYIDSLTLRVDTARIPKEEN